MQKPIVHLNGESILHEIGHWLVAGDLVSHPEFGLGESNVGRSSATMALSYKEAEVYECKASLAGIELFLLLGLNPDWVLEDHNWTEYGLSAGMYGAPMALEFFRKHGVKSFLPEWLGQLLGSNSLYKRLEGYEAREQLAA